MLYALLLILLVCLPVSFPFYRNPNDIWMHSRQYVSTVRPLAETEEKEGTTPSLKKYNRLLQDDPSYLPYAIASVGHHLRGGLVSSPREAMIAITILKRSNDMSLVTAFIRHLLESENSSKPGDTLDTGVFNNALDGCARAGSRESAEELLQLMHLHGIPRDVVTYTNLLRVYTRQQDCNAALKVLGRMQSEDGVLPDAKCFTALIGAFAKKGRLRDALGLLRVMMQPDTRYGRAPLQADACTYNVLIDACARSGEWFTALRLMEVMRQTGIALDSYTYTSAISACSAARQPAEVIRLLNQISKDMHCPAHHTVPYNAALHGLVQHCGELETALQLFGGMKTRLVPSDTVTYSTLITALMHDYRYAEVLRLVDEVLSTSLPRNLVIYGSGIIAADRLEDTESMEAYLRQMLADSASPAPTPEMFNLVILRVGRAFGYTRAFGIFEEMTSRGVPRSLHTYNALLRACKAEGRYEEALKTLEDMQTDSLVRLDSDRADFSSSLNATEEAAAVRRLFSFLHLDSKKKTQGDASARVEVERIMPDTVSYSTAIAVCVEAKQWGLALDLFSLMESRQVRCSRITYNSVIEALDVSGETIRAGLVYQGGLSSGLYQHWLSPEKEYTRAGERVMDLHQYSLAVAKTAVMHVLGEICVGDITTPDPLVIITGRGNHPHASGTMGGHLRFHLRALLEKDLGLSLRDSEGERNPGRLVVSQKSLRDWKQRLEAQERNELVGGLASGGAVHGERSLFLQVARAKSKRSVHTYRDTATADELRPIDVRAACPFSSAKLVEGSLPSGAEAHTGRAVEIRSAVKTPSVHLDKEVRVFVMENPAHSSVHSLTRPVSLPETVDMDRAVQSCPHSDSGSFAAAAPEVRRCPAHVRTDKTKEKDSS